MNKTWKDRFFTPTEIVEIENVLTEEYSEHLRDGESFEVEGAFEKDSLLLTVILKNADESFYYPFEIRVLHEKNKELAINDAKDKAIDFVGAYFSEYFMTGRDTFIPIDWTTYDFMGITIMARAQILNRRLEKEADDLLRKAEILGDKTK